MGNIPEFINGHMGIHEVADIGRRLGVVGTDSIECSMLDYADFNYQHTLEVQFMLFDVVLGAVSRYGNADLTKAATWVRDAQLNQSFTVPNDSSEHQVTQGMFSGVRSTDFMNTILNLGYFRAAQTMVRDATGLEPVDLVNIHKGDDVWITNRSRLWAIEIYRAMAEAGFVFQGSKQMFDIGRGEFLRVLYTKDGARGYAMRAVATLLVKPIQSVIEQAPQNRATSLTSQIHLLFRRGISRECCEILWWACVPHALRLRLPDRAGVGIPVGVAMKAFRQGGLDLGPPGTIGSGGIPSQPLPAPVAHTTELEAALGHHMSHDWIVQISKRVAEAFNAPALEAGLHAANVSDSLRPCDRQRSMRMLEKALKRWRDTVGTNSKMLEGSRVPLETGTNRTYHSDAVAKQMAEVLRCYVSVGSGPVVIPNVVGKLQHAFTQSPFRDISDAHRAFGGSLIYAARFCIALTYGTVVGKEASVWLESMVSRLGVEVTTCILQGIRGVGISHESILHPIILSLVSQIGTNCAIITAGPSFITNQYDWGIWLDCWMAAILDSMCFNTDVREWSHY